MSDEYVVQAVHQQGMHFVATIGERSVSLDYPLAPGDPGAGLRPMEMLLASLAACAGGTVAALLRRAGQSPDSLTVTARGLRRTEHPTVFTEIGLEFAVTGNVAATTMAAILEQAEARVCPVWAMLKASTPITASFSIDGM